MLNKIILVIFVFCTTLIRADIFEIERINEIRSVITKDALVLIDVDDTLITNKSQLGSPAWRKWMKPELPKKLTSFALYDALTLYIAKNIPYKPVEPETVQLIEGLQNEGILVFAFTARGRSEWYTTKIEGVDQFTRKQLISAKIDFTKTLLPESTGLSASPYFDYGIIFAQHVPKGEMLQQIVQDLRFMPGVIVFVDDKREQVESMEAAAIKIGIPFIGFHYRRVELDNAAVFSPKVANQELISLLGLNSVFSSDSEVDIPQILHAVDAETIFLPSLQYGGL